MRISWDRDDPGYELLDQIRKTGDAVWVFLDGVPLRYVMTADEEEGFVIVTQTDSNGHPIYKDDEWLLETKHGQVKVVLDKTRL